MQPKAGRRPMHKRSLEMQAFARDDGLWDIEAHLRDEKPFAYVDPVRGTLKPGDPVHDILVRLTVDDEHVIHDVDIEMGSMPFGTCHEVKDSLRPLIGVRIGRGWREALKSIPRTATCTHVRELLAPLATVLHQGIALGREPEGKTALVAGEGLTAPPFFVDDCYSWRSDGPAVLRFYPQFARRRS